MRTWILLFLMGVVTQSSVWGRDILLVAKGGLSSYGSVYIGNLGGGGGDQNWNSGPIVGLGIRLRETDAFALEGMVEYSTHSYDPAEYEPPPINDPKNKI